MMAVFGYYSLLNDFSVEHTTKSKKTLFPCKVNGFTRTFNAHRNRFICSQCYVDNNGEYVDNFSFATIEENKSTFVNGVLFFVDEKELFSLDEREILYDRVELDKESIFFYGESVKLDVVYTYVAKKNLLTNCFVSKHYHELGFKGAKTIDSIYLGFLKDFVDTTEKLSVDRIKEMFQVKMIGGERCLFDESTHKLKL